MMVSEQRTVSHRNTNRIYRCSDGGTKCKDPEVGQCFQSKRKSVCLDGVCE